MTDVIDVGLAATTPFAAAAIHAARKSAACVAVTAAVGTHPQAQDPFAGVLAHERSLQNDNDSHFQGDKKEKSAFPPQMTGP